MTPCHSSWRWHPTQIQHVQLHSFSLQGHAGTFAKSVKMPGLYSTEYGSESQPCPKDTETFLFHASTLCEIKTTAISYQLLWVLMLSKFPSWLPSFKAVWELIFWTWDSLSLGDWKSSINLYHKPFSKSCRAEFWPQKNKKKSMIKTLGLAIIKAQSAVNVFAVLLNYFLSIMAFYNNIQNTLHYF